MYIIDSETNTNSQLRNGIKRFEIESHTLRMFLTTK